MNEFMGRLTWLAERLVPPLVDALSDEDVELAEEIVDADEDRDDEVVDDEQSEMDEDAEQDEDEDNKADEMMDDDEMEDELLLALDNRSMLGSKTWEPMELPRRTANIVGSSR